MTSNKNLIIILAASLILLIAGTYYLSQVNQSPISEGERELQMLRKQSSSDETEDIESDLKDTDFEDLDNELMNIEAELNSTTEAETQ